METSVIDWTGCGLVVRRENYIGGKPALWNDPRVPPEVIVDNMDAGDSAGQVIEAYALRTVLEDVQAIYDYVRRQRALVA